MSYYPFTVVLSASVPLEKRSQKYQENYTKIKNAQIQIEEAVIGLSRNIFQAGGKIIFGGHPSISPLVAMVATEFKINKEIENSKRNEIGEKLITIYQSKAFEKIIPKETTSLFNLGYSDIIWTDAIDQEQPNPNIKDKPQCEKSLAYMRREMMRGSVDALICIGGMDGVEREFEIFHELHPTKPVFILKSTGGASKILATEFANSNFVWVIDSGYYPYRNEENGKGDTPEKFEIIPYSYFTALIIKQILDSKNK
jgi:hypothetical protein